MKTDRDLFREGCLKRDNGKCVVCGSPATEVHHILERRLFEEGGYIIDNGASVCEPCHLRCEQTLITCEELRERCGIRTAVLPAHMYSDQPVDKWGNPLLANGMRMRGELFDDESVQKVLKQGNVLNLFTNRVKYARTYHLPFSPGVTQDDRIMTDMSELTNGQELVATVKQDGENTTWYNDYVHARSLEFQPHPSRDWVKALHGRIAYNLPENWRLCGENLYAVHSIEYKNLDDYFQVFSVWNEKNVCLSWDETVEWAALLDLQMVPTLYRGPWDEDVIRGLYRPEWRGDPMEGFVVRTAASFHYSRFRRHVAKYVRAGHVVHRDGHWSNRRVVPNQLLGSTVGTR